MKEQQVRPDDEAGLEELLKRAGARETPAAELTADVRRAVYAEWRAVVDERKRRRTWVSYGLAASLAAVLLVVALVLRTTSYTPIPVATVARAAGPVRLTGHDEAAAVQTGQQVSVGDRLHTGAQAQLALAMGPGLSVRVDQGSEIVLTARDRIELRAGALYVDAAPDSAHEPLTVETDAGSIAHLGTQFQVRDLGESVAVSVREGRVQIITQRGAHEAAAGQRVNVANAGALERDRISSTDVSWRWAEQAAPDFEIEGRPLAEFLAWCARETGRTLVYRDEATKQKAAEIRLRGDISGLDPDTALKAVLATTPVQREQSGPEAIVVSLASN